MNENSSAINWQQLDDITGNDRELAKEFLVFFLQNAQIYIDEMSDKKINPEEFSKICHKLKGAAKSVGAETLAELAFKGEKMQNATNSKQKVLIQELKVNIKEIEVCI